MLSALNFTFSNVVNNHSESAYFCQGQILEKMSYVGYLPNIPAHKSTILGNFFASKVGGLPYIWVWKFAVNCCCHSGCQLMAFDAKIDSTKESFGINNMWCHNLLHLGLPCTCCHSQLSELYTVVSHGWVSETSITLCVVCETWYIWYGNGGQAREGARNSALIAAEFSNGVQGEHKK